MDKYKGKNATQSRYRAKTYEQIAIKSRKEFGRKDKIEAAAKAQGMSAQAWMLAAIDAALERDGLPRPTPGARQDDNIP